MSMHKYNQLSDHFFPLYPTRWVDHIGLLSTYDDIVYNNKDLKLVGTSLFLSFHYHEDYHLIVKTPLSIFVFQNCIRNTFKYTDEYELYKWASGIGPNIDIESLIYSIAL